VPVISDFKQPPIRAPETSSIILTVKYQHDRYAEKLMATEHLTYNNKFYEIYCSFNLNTIFDPTYNNKL